MPVCDSDESCNACGCGRIAGQHHAVDARTALVVVHGHTAAGQKNSNLLTGAGLNSAGAELSEKALVGAGQ